MKITLIVDADDLKVAGRPVALNLSVTPLDGGPEEPYEGPRVRTVDLTADEDGFLPVLPKEGR